MTKRAKRPPTTPPAAGPADDLPSVPSDVQPVSIARIETPPGLNHRDGLRDVDALAASMRAQGQLSPIMVRRNPTGTFLLIFGHRRLAAARNLGWEAIEAIVVEADDPRSDEAIRATENVQRDALSPVEEAVAVARALEDYRLSGAEAGAAWDPEGPPPAEAIAAVAANLGRSPRWVRDRLYVGRLSGRARGLVADGLLPLSHAREIAKLADPRLRDEAAEMFAGLPESECDEVRDVRDVRPAPLSQVRRFVAERTTSLRVVPWRLDAPFAGKPACTVCPANTANDLALFAEGAGLPDVDAPQDGRETHADERPETPARCVSPLCYRHKTRAAERAIEKGVAKARGMAPAAGGAPAPADLRRIVPAGLKETSFVRAVRAEIAPAEPATRAARAARDAGPSAEEKRADKARREAERRIDDWENQAIEAITGALAKAPLVLLAFGGLEASPSIEKIRGARWGPEKKREAAIAAFLASPSLRRLLDAVRARDAGAIAGLMDPKTLRAQAAYGMDHLPTAAIAAIAEAAGVTDLPPIPGSEPAPAVAKATAAPKTKKAAPKGRKKAPVAL